MQLAPLRGVLFASLAVVSACVTPAVPRTLGWRAGAPPLTLAEGNVAVASVKNRRPPDRGGGDSSVVGYLRGTFEERTLLRTDDVAGPLLLSVRELVSDALRSAGIGVTSSDDRSATALVNVDVRELWSDEVTPARGTIVLDLIVLDPATHAERARVTVQGRGEIGSSRVASSVECAKAPTSAPCATFVLPMNDVYRDIMAAFQGPELRASVLAKR